MACLYIHVPFCHAKCRYCDFYSLPNHSYIDRFVQALEKEWNIRSKEIENSRLQTIYFGGGTPSILDLDHLEQITRWLPGEDVEEVTIEVNPEDVTADKVKIWKELLHVNRVSMGVQSLDDVELKQIGRRHSATDALAAIQSIHQAGIDNLSLDLIYGLPGQTIQSWKTSLEKILEQRPEHLSAYMLSYEPGTVLHSLLKLGKIKETDEDVLLEMYEILCKKAREYGYEHYEISNFALPGKHSRHNSSYWTGEKYLGLGPGAHSFDGEKRRYNPRNIKIWLECVENNQPAFDVDYETETDKINDLIMVSLRTSKGLQLQKIPKHYRESIILKALSLGNDRINYKTAESILLIPELAWMVSDDTIAELFV